ncbi:hypothetical protein LEMA_P004680.1 [Plenodomus lingam JN3]|uniref:Transmembrane protein n=1 Tax=Leptosphaeria maculans (strain JN3 / isolate v23.1.3 / race Av1-4-5-6-7-8) TaxID=985895 RepID=E5AEP2_LEPMJ|nr:hypothetical protein LEMA_P004680.1 [Plenodomus lingam JN3]CBY01681.1 hypothetical protein LEMA_P004680.1 [Plenodomus lingam JN3]
MSEVDGQFVKRGLWTNLDQGNIMGKTITTDSTTGMIIIAMLAVMSTVGTSHLWSLLLFGHHQLRANGQPSDGLFYQQQAILRTLPPPSSLMAESTKLWWFWRRKNDRVLSRSISQFLLATSCTVGFIAASISTSFVMNTSDLEVLVRSPSCGHLNDTMTLEARRDSTTALSSVSTPYAEECYRRQSTPSARCKAYVHPRISFKTERVHCPFNETMCVENNDKDLPAVALDSGLLDVGTTYGLNLPKSDHVSYRKRTTCSVLPLAGHTELVDTDDVPTNFLGRDAYPGEQAMLLYYGERYSSVESVNYTRGVSLLSTNLSSGFNVVANVFRLDWERQGNHQSIVPLESMHRDDADLLLVFLIASVKYVRPVDDPWFSAHKQVIVYDPTRAADATVYHPDSPVRVLGCAVQLDALPISRKLPEWEEASLLQQSVLDLLTRTSAATDMHDVTQLRASQKIRYGGNMFVDVPSDQWVDEVEGMESYVWAASQVSVADYAIGHGIRNPDMAEWVVAPTTPGDKKLCGCLKMRKQGGFVTSNINVFGMVFVITVSAIFAILDITLLKVLVFLDSFRTMFSPRIDRWIQDGVLQLQRRAYEAEGQGTWSNLKRDIPLTREKEILTELPLQSGTKARIYTSASSMTVTSVEYPLLCNGRSQAITGDCA